MKYLVLSTLFLALVTLNSAAKTTRFKSVENTDFVGDYYASSMSGKYGVLVLGGSGGGRPEHLANKIADLGYSVLSLAYFKEKGLPEELEMIPLEYFDAPKQWLLKQKETRSDGLLVVGWSKGAELSLLLASRDRQYKGIIGIAPSSVVWAGILKDWTKIPSSSWSLDKQPLAYVPFASGVTITKLVDLYTASLDNKNAVAQSSIEVEKIDSPTLLLTGGNDEIWPANRMATAVCQQMNADQNHQLCTHVNYQDAGHLLDEQFIIGGTLETNAKANKDSKLKIARFLDQLNAQ